MGNTGLGVKVFCKQCKKLRPSAALHEEPCPYCGSKTNGLLLDIPEDAEETKPLDKAIVPEFENKSVVIYYPDFVINDPRLLTTLCLYHDKILLFLRNSPDETLGALGEKIKSEINLQEDHSKFKSFISSPLPQLSEAGLLQVVTSNDCDLLFPKAGELQINKKIIQEIITTHHNPHLGMARGTTVGQLIRALNAYSVAKRYDIPLVGDFGFHQATTSSAKSEIHSMANILAHSAITHLALPDIVAFEPEDILFVRDRFKNELAEFRIGILELSWLLRQGVKNKEDLAEVKYEAEIIVNSKIQAALLSLERKIKSHEKAKVKRILTTSGKILINCVKLFLPTGVSDMILSGSKGIFELAMNLDASKSPNDQVASFIYQLRKSPDIKKKN